jgi:hypothetical protein
MVKGRRRPVPAALLSQKDPRWATRSLRTGVENRNFFPITGVCTPNLAACKESLTDWAMKPYKIKFLKFTQDL